MLAHVLSTIEEERKGEMLTSLLISATHDWIFEEKKICSPIPT